METRYRRFSTMRIIEHGIQIVTFSILVATGLSQRFYSFDISLWFILHAGGIQSDPFDISPDMNVYYCFPLSNYRRKSLFEFDSVEQIDAHFRATRDPIKAEIPGIFRECDGCRDQEDGLCAGGGLCHAVHGFIDEAPIRLPEIEHEVAKIRLS